MTSTSAGASTPSESVPDQAPEIRNAMTDTLCRDGRITSPVVEAAFRTVPRHAFAPEGTPLEVAYNDADSVATKRNEHGVVVSSISAPFIQARMIEQAQLRPGMSVLEVGSGGFNAALLAEVVGPDGRVVSVDIDPEITDRAAALLDAAGYGSRVTVAVADAEHGVPEFGVFDAIIVTVGAWDIPPVWLAQLADTGRLVLPLVMNGITRSIAFGREADHLVSTSAEVCGFVPMQGIGQHPERVFSLPDPQGHHVKLRFDSGPPADPALLDGALGTERTDLWSGVTIAYSTSFADLHLWFACFLDGFCQLAVEEGTALASERKHWFPYAVVRGDSFAYLAVRPLPDNSGVEFGARAYGAHAQTPASALVAQVQAWNELARSGPEPTFTYWPVGTAPARFTGRTAVLDKTHGRVRISWPTTT